MSQPYEWVQTVGQCGPAGIPSCLTDYFPVDCTVTACAGYTITYRPGPHLILLYNANPVYGNRVVATYHGEVVDVTYQNFPGTG